jgi:hypothetical protein
MDWGIGEQAEAGGVVTESGEMLETLEIAGWAPEGG